MAFALIIGVIMKTLQEPMHIYVKKLISYYS